MKKTQKSLLLFLTICFPLSFICYYLIIAHGILEFASAAMWCPALASFITCLIYHRGENALNFRCGRRKYIFAGICLPLLYWGISYGIYLMIYGKEVITDNMLLNLLQMPAILLLNLGIFFVTAMGEEIGWRGYMAPKLYELFGFGKGAFISGVIWTLWHSPLFIAGYMSDIPLWYQLPVLAILCISLSYPMFYLSIRSKSAWPCILLHFIHNFVAQLLLDQSIGGDMRPYLVGETGIISVTVIVIIAIVIAVRCRHNGIQNNIACSRT